MSGEFTEFALKLLNTLNVPAKCAHCGNDNLDELAITGRGKVICRLDIAAVSEACSNHDVGWRVVDPNGKVVSSGSGITFKPTSILTE